MKHTIQDYELELIDDPLQSHVVAWEKANRALKTGAAVPLLEGMQDAFGTVSVDKFDPQQMIGAFLTASKLLREALKIIADNESLTVTANHGVMVKAALQAGWIVSFRKGDQAIVQTPEEVDNAKPWLMTWAAEKIAHLYLEATSIPKN